MKLEVDERFTSSQFHTGGFSLPYRLDRNRNGWCVLIFVSEDIPSKFLTKHNFLSDAEGLFVELVCLLSLYQPPAQNHQYFFDCIDKALDTYSNCDNVLLAWDFNAEEDLAWKRFSTFLYQQDLYNLAKVGTCFKFL